MEHGNRARSTKGPDHSTHHPLTKLSTRRATSASALLTGRLCVDGELVLVMGLAGGERAALHLDLGGVADLLRADHDLERRAGDLRSLLLHGHQVLADLTRRERNAWRRDGRQSAGCSAPHH